MQERAGDVGAVEQRPHAAGVEGVVEDHGRAAEQRGQREVQQADPERGQVEQLDVINIPGRAERRVSATSG